MENVITDLCCPVCSVKQNKIIPLVLRRDHNREQLLWCPICLEWLDIRVIHHGYYSEPEKKIFVARCKKLATGNSIKQ